MRALAVLAILTVTACGSLAADPGPALEAPKPLSVAEACDEVQGAVSRNFYAPPFTGEEYSAFAEEVQSIQGRSGRAAQPVLDKVIDAAQEAAFSTVTAASGKEAGVILARAVRETNQACADAGAPLDN